MRMNNTFKSVAFLEPSDVVRRAHGPAITRAEADLEVRDEEGENDRRGGHEPGPALFEESFPHAGRLGVRANPGHRLAAAPSGAAGERSGIAVDRPLDGYTAPMRHSLGSNPAVALDNCRLSDGRRDRGLQAVGSARSDPTAAGHGDFAGSLEPLRALLEDASAATMPRCNSGTAVRSPSRARASLAEWSLRRGDGRSGVARSGGDAARLRRSGHAQLLHGHRDARIASSKRIPTTSTRCWCAPTPMRSRG